MTTCETPLSLTTPDQHPSQRPRRASLVRAEPGSFTPGRYEQQGSLGNGTYGRVVRCVDNTDKKVVAVKIVNPQPAYRRSALNEITVLQALQHCPSVVKLRDHFDTDGRIHIVTEILYRNLYQVSSTTNFQPMPLNQIRQISENVLRGLAELHHCRYMHCDVKPENVMLRSKNAFEDTILIDFGSVRKFSENMYYDIQSLWYRAPEVICGLPYTHQIDSWSVGCLLYELHTGSPLFPSEGPQDALSRIIAVVGYPSTDAMQKGTNARNLEFAPASSGLFNGGVNPLNEPFIGDAAQIHAFRDLLLRLLQPDEKNRLSCADALNHPFVTGFHNNNSTPIPGPKSPMPNNSSMSSQYVASVGRSSTSNEDLIPNEMSGMSTGGISLTSPLMCGATSYSSRKSSPTISPPLPVDEWEMI